MVGRASARSAPPKGWRSSARPHGASRASWREMGSAEVAQFLTSLAVERFIKACAERGIDRGRIVALEPGESWHYYK